MINYYLKNQDEAEFDGLMLLTGLGMKTDDGVMPASYEVLIDKIGSITIWDYSVEPPISTTYPEFYSNVRLMFEPSNGQVTALTAYAVDPSQPQYREWA